MIKALTCGLLVGSFHTVYGHAHGEDTLMISEAVQEGTHTLSPAKGTFCSCDLSKFKNLEDFATCIETDAPGCTDLVQVRDTVTYKTTDTDITENGSVLTLPYIAVAHTFLHSIEAPVKKPHYYGSVSIDDTKLDGDLFHWQSAGTKDVPVSKISFEDGATNGMTGSKIVLTLTKKEDGFQNVAEKPALVVYNYVLNGPTTSTSTSKPSETSVTTGATSSTKLSSTTKVSTTAKTLTSSKITDSKTTDSGDNTEDTPGTADSGDRYNGVNPSILSASVVVATALTVFSV